METQFKELQTDIWKGIFTADYERVDAIEKMLTLAFKELGKTALFSVYQVSMESGGAALGYLKDNKLLIPKKITVLEDTNFYAERLADEFHNNQQLISRLNSHIESNSLINYLSAQMISSIRKKIIQTALDQPQYYTIISDSFDIDGNLCSIAVQIEKSAYIKSYNITGIKTVLDEIRCDSEITGLFPPECFYSDNCVTFREFIIERIISEYINNSDTYKYLSDGMIADKLKYLLRDTARDFIRLIQIYKLELCSSDANQEYDIFRNLDMIATLNYEGTEVNSNLLMCKASEIEDSCMSIKFLEPIKLSEYKKIRKLLEISKDELSLVSDGYMVYGFIGYENISRRLNICDMFTVKFMRRNMWKISYVSAENPVEIMDVEYSFPKLQKSKIDFNEFLIAFHYVFKSEEQDMLKIFDIINVACEQKNGTMLVFSEAAESEAKRLKKASVCIDQRHLEPLVVKYATAIDGAVLFDSSGVCYAIGVILDGMSGISACEDISRGARFNAAAKYLAGNKTVNCVVVIVSEDGNIDIMYNSEYGQSS